MYCSPCFTRGSVRKRCASNRNSSHLQKDAYLIVVHSQYSYNLSIVIHIFINYYVIPAFEFDNFSPLL